MPNRNTKNKIITLEKQASEEKTYSLRELLENGALRNYIKGKKIKSRHLGNSHTHYKKAADFQKEADFIRNNMETRRTAPPQYNEL
ncbi:hypothetical protein D3C81_1786630 [compost metagenome]